jgi:hypothetical protein
MVYLKADILESFQYSVQHSNHIGKDRNIYLFGVPDDETLLLNLCLL